MKIEFSSGNFDRPGCDLRIINKFGEQTVVLENIGELENLNIGLASIIKDCQWWTKDKKRGKANNSPAIVRPSTGRTTQTLRKTAK